nr:hypothetical protein [uncultured Romboutsia sp.]
MKTIRVKKENFDIDGICGEITEAVINDLLNCEGIVHPAIIDYMYNENADLDSVDYEEIDYETAKEKFYKGDISLALTFATMGSEDGYIGCANGKEYKIKDEEDDYEPFAFGWEDIDEEEYEYEEDNEKSSDEDEIESLDVGVLTVCEEAANILYLECYDGYIYISTAHYGTNCMGRTTILEEENWGEFDDVVLEFIQRFIKDEIKK